ncbi:hypothetical protein KC19_5G103400 [Ceratodon purpureus]|uniref:Uncharacterized protein n=1 Tax=Ceratodon purpureus TaxID=3225 RepID=A0A8T0HZX3_CERPU|nr:hypothetical protein KC19_5G103400 [Ceratodon purpureus]
MAALRGGVRPQNRVRAPGARAWGRDDVARWSARVRLRPVAALGRWRRFRFGGGLWPRAWADLLRLGQSSGREISPPPPAPPGPRFDSPSWPRGPRPRANRSAPLGSSRGFLIFPAVHCTVGTWEVCPVPMLTLALICSYPLPCC